MQAELAELEAQIQEREASFAALLPEWEAHRATETAEKKRLDAARARLDALYAKRGRVEKFRTRAERDRYLRAEIASVEAYQRAQAEALQQAQNDLQTARNALQEVEAHSEAAIERAEDGRARAKELGDDIAKLKSEHTELSEKRKELWREETKLRSLVDNEADELRSAERLLASMMDKVIR
jgi:structural maintenance of chromosome 3 (chondroitin sulfate proteoglycan 6)